MDEEGGQSTVDTLLCLALTCPSPAGTDESSLAVSLGLHTEEWVKVSIRSESLPLQ